MLSKKHLPLVIIVGLLMLGTAFYTGRLSAPTKSSMTSNNPHSGLEGQGRGAMNGNDRSQGDQIVRDNLVNGTIISQDEKSLTLNLAEGGSKIIYLSPSTKIVKMTEAAMADLSIGQTVMVNGSTNSDGSLSAQMVQLRSSFESLPVPSGLQVDNALDVETK